jgi:hypothetical protein
MSELKGRVGLALTIIMMVIGGSVYAYYFAYGRTAMVYDVCQAKEYLWRARSCGNLEDIAAYMGKALKAIEGRSGNPNWLWHLPDTDFDLIKHDIQANMQVALNVSKTEPMGSYGYQRAVDNMQEICVELNEHLDCTIVWLTNLAPSTIILNVIGWAIFIAGIIMMATAEAS